MTQEQREKIAETMGALYIASTCFTNDDLQMVLAGYADNLSELLANDSYTIKAADVGATDKGLEIPEATDEPSVAEILENMKAEFTDFWDQFTKLRGNVCQLEKKVNQNETDIMMLWDKVNR